MLPIADIFVTNLKASMFINFDELENKAKVFLYPSSKKLYPELLTVIDKKVNDFMIDWCEKHNIQAGFTIKHKRFIIIAINNQEPITTTIIDDLVGFIFKLQLAHNVELLDKLNVCFKQGAHIQYKDVKAFKQLIKNKSVNKSTIVFDNLINTKEQLETDWELPAEDTWYARMF